MSDTQLRIIKIAIRFMLCFAAIVLVIKIYGFVDSGTVTASVSGQGNFIKISRLADNAPNKGSTFTKEAQQKLSARLRPGNYTITAYGQSSLTNKVIALKARQNLSFDLNLTVKVVSEPVYGYEAQSFVGGKDQLFFINPTSGSLVKIDGNNELSTIYADSVLRGAHWAGASLGLVSDQYNHLYIIRDGVLSSLPLPFQVSNDASLSYDISSNGIIYASNGHAIYRGSPSENLHKIYELSNSDGQIGALFAGADAVAVLERNGERNAISIVSPAGELVKKTVAGKLVSWSSDGQFLAVSGDSPGALYNKQLEQIALLPNHDTTQLAWAGKDTLLYESGGTLWSYGLHDEQSTALTDDIPGSTNTGVVVSDDSSYAYLTLKTGDSGRVVRIGLKQQKITATLSRLGDFFPKNIGACTVDYVNFKYPTMHLAPFPDSPDGECEAAVRTELNQDGINPDALQYITAPIAT